MAINIHDLKESNDFLNILIDNIVSGIFVVDHEIKIRAFNDSFNTLFYKDEDEIIGSVCGNALGCIHVITEGGECGTTSNCDACDLRGSLLRAFINKVPAYKEKLIREFYIQGRFIKKFFQFTTKPILYKNQEMVLVILDDITDFEENRKELRSKNEELIELNNQKNELLGIAAHDLRSPIGGIFQLSSLLKHSIDKGDNDRSREYLSILEERSKFSLNLLNDLLDISKIESGKLDLQISKTDYLQLVKKNIEFNRYIADKKQIEILLDVDQEDVYLDIDGNKIDQVLSNLISNAIKFSPSYTTIHVSVRQVKDEIYTEVKDQGAGIPENEIDNLFKAFQKTSVRSTGGEKSTGLGLAISKKIVDGHNGIIGLNSTQGEGTSFYFTLPLK